MLGDDVIEFLLQGIYMFLEDSTFLVMLSAEVDQLQLHLSLGLVLHRTQPRCVLASVNILLL